jgi:hypothetical protein
LSRWGVFNAIAQRMRLRSESGQIRGEFGEAVPLGEACGELFLIERSAEQTALERDVLPDRDPRQR